MLSPKNWSSYCTELEKFWAFQWSFASNTWILSWNGWRTLKHRNFSDEKPFTQVVIVKELNYRWRKIWCITPLTKFFFFFPMKDSFTAWETLAKKQVFSKIFYELWATILNSWTYINFQLLHFDSYYNSKPGLQKIELPCQNFKW